MPYYDSAEALPDPHLAALLAERLRKQQGITSVQMQTDPMSGEQRPVAASTPQGPVPKSVLDRLMGGLLGRPQTYGGMLGEQDVAAARQRARIAMAAALLANSGPSTEPRGRGQIIGGAILAGRQAQDDGLQQALQAMLLKSKMQPRKSKLQEEYEYARSQGYEGTVDDWKRVSSIEAKDPALLQEYNLYREQELAAGGQPVPYMRWLDLRTKATTQPGYAFPVIAGVPHAGNTRTGSVQPLTDINTVSGNAGQIQESESRAAELAKAQAGRDATFQEDLNVLDDEILRTQRLLTEFQSGKYQTGPLAGKLPNFRTSAQDLQREQGKDVIKAISSATFGALSEGEREFLRNLGISESATEESNINMLEQRLAQLTRTKQRLLTRSRLGVGPNAAPTTVEVGQTTTINGAKVRRVR